MATDLLEQTFGEIEGSRMKYWCKTPYYGLRPTQAEQARNDLIDWLTDKIGPGVVNDVYTSEDPVWLAAKWQIGFRLVWFASLADRTFYMLYWIAD